MNSRLIFGASISREATCAARDAPAERLGEELFFHYQRVGLLT